MMDDRKVKYDGEDVVSVATGLKFSAIYVPDRYAASVQTDNKSKFGSPLLHTTDYVLAHLMVAEVAERICGVMPGDPNLDLLSV